MLSLSEKVKNRQQTKPIVSKEKQSTIIVEPKKDKPIKHQPKPSIDIKPEDEIGFMNGLIASER